LRTDESKAGENEPASLPAIKGIGDLVSRLPLEGWQQALLGCADSMLNGDKF